jgi:hypothetical protein
MHTQSDIINYLLVYSKHIPTEVYGIGDEWIGGWGSLVMDVSHADFICCRSKLPFL